MYLDGDDDDPPIGGEPTENTNLEEGGDDEPPEPGEEQEPSDDHAQVEEAPAPEPHRKMTANEVIRSTKARLRQAEVDLAAERAARNTQREAPAWRPDPAVAAAAERRRLEEMPDVDRVQYMAQRLEQQTNIQLQQMRLEMQVNADRLSFRDTITATPEYGKYEAAVGKELLACMQRGQARTRDELLSIAIGNEVKANRAAAVGKARRAATKNVQQQTTKPSSVRSGVGTTTRGAEQSAEETLFGRLESGEYWR